MWVFIIGNKSTCSWPRLKISNMKTNEWANRPFTPQGWYKSFSFEGNVVVCISHHAVQTSCTSKFLFLAPRASACPSTCYTLVHSRSLQQSFLQQSHAWRCTTKPMHCKIGSFVSSLFNWHLSLAVGHHFQSAALSATCGASFIWLFDVFLLFLHLPCK